MPEQCPSACPCPLCPSCPVSPWPAPGRCSNPSLLCASLMSLSDLFLSNLCPNGIVKIRINREVSNCSPSPPFSAPISCQASPWAAWPKHHQGAAGWENVSINLGMVQGTGKQGLCGTGAWKAGPVCSEKGLNLTHKNPTGDGEATVTSMCVVWFNCAGPSARVWTLFSVSLAVAWLERALGAGVSLFRVEQRG